MARVTVEDAVDQIGNRFDLVLVAAKRARQIATEGKEPLVEMGNDKATVVALREIEQGLVNYDTLEAQALADQQQAQSEEFSFVASALSE